MNRGAKKQTRQPNPLLSASILSKITFWWLKPMFAIGLKRAIEEDDIYAVTNDMQSEQNTNAFVQLWDLELKKTNPSIFRVMLKLYGPKVLPVGILFSIGETIARLIQPICLGGFVSYFTNGSGVSSNEAFWYATGIVLSTAMMTLIFHPFTLYMSKMACNVRVGCSGLIYRKTLRLLKSSTEEGQNGKIINLLTNDLAKFELGLQLVHDTWKGPLEAFAFFVVIYYHVGISAVIGMACLVGFIPLQAWIGKKSAQFRLKNAERTDFRVKIMNEILLGIQVIKMYAWEKSFAKMVDQIRKREVDAIRSIAYTRATILALSMISKASIFVTLVSYVYLTDKITAQKVFIVSSYFNILELSMFYFWPVALTQTAEAYIAIKRLQEFLLRPETKLSQSIKSSNGTQLKNGSFKNGHMVIKPTFDKNKHRSSEVFLDDENGIFSISYSQNIREKPCERIQSVNNVEKCIRFDNVTAVWERNEGLQMNGIFEFNTEIKTGLTAVIGPVGSGKSTLLNVILGELELDLGTLTVNGSISYASQEPWIFGGTVRNNIVFVEEFDEQRYNKVVEVCALERDFKLFPQGDETVVGEQGSSLSGGQKARVNLARAIYKQSDIYLLDDPLSAVDAHVGKHIFELCVKEFLADKVCVLVTHQLQYLKSVKNIILMEKGRIEMEGSYQTLCTLKKESLMFNHDDGEQNAVQTQRKIVRHLSSISSVTDEFEDDANDRRERQLTGYIKFSTYKSLFKAAQSAIYVVVVFLIFLTSQLTWSGADFFLSEWVDWEECATNLTAICDSFAVDKPVNEKRDIYVSIYACIIVIGTLCYFGRSFSFYRMCLQISINLHDMIFRGISRAKMIFFNNNPSGRILNRFARDINNVDTLLPNILFDVCDCFLHYIAIIMIDVYVNPWLLIPAAVMTILFYLIRLVYVNTGRSFKRIEALSRSPIFSHVNATLQGSTTVHAFNAANILENEFHQFQDHNTSSFYLFTCASRWFALSLDVVSLLFSVFVTYSFLLFEDSMGGEGGKVGLAILSSINLIGLCQWGMRQSAELENQMTSVERILEYADLPSEPPLESDDKHAPPKDWPMHGSIEFNSLSLRYAESSSRILRDLTFRINAKEKVGVVGRTGAGKSSIIQSLFRLAQNEGQILIDGVDIGVIGLHDLRKKISIIPQEAVLFSGSLRFNLDPFDEKSDDQLWDALEQVELRLVVSSLPGGLDCKVLDGGSNFSAGQRQLLCLARAILRNNKILILDEATANVDSETDKLIQETIRHKFANCTVITIAHRLHTVMDSDKVLVVDAGEIMEFDHPYELIKNRNGFFKQLLDQTGSATANALAMIAKQSYEMRKKTK